MSRDSEATELNAAGDGPPSPWHGMTWRSLALGVLIVLIINICSPYAEFVLHTTYLATNYFPLGLIFPFFVIVAVVNVILKSISRRLALSPRELGVVFIMGLAAVAIPTYGVTGYLLSTIAAPFYHASPENKWAETFHSFVPSWIAPRDEQAMQWFFEGLPLGQSIPWAVWARPLLWWIPLVGAVLFMCLCIVVMLRKQWVDKERLTYPLAEVPLEMIKDSDDGRLLPLFMRSRAFWWGFGIFLFIILWNIIGYFHPMFPQISLHFGNVRIGRGFPGIHAKIYPPMAGIAFLLHLNVSFSVWFFVLLGIIQTGVFNRLGYSIGHADVYCSHPAALAWQGWGGFVVMVLVGLWIAREQIKDVFGKALGLRPNVDDSREILSYRVAAFGFVICLVYIVGWLRVSGMDFRVISLFMFAALVAYIGLARIVVEGGLVFLRPPLIPQAFATYTLGSATIGPRCMTAIGFSYAWYCDIIDTFIPSGANAAKIGSSLGIGRRAMFTAIVTAMVVGFAASLWYTIYLAYHTGAFNFTRWVFGGGAKVPFNNIRAKLLNPFGPDWNRLMFMGLGGAVMAVLTFLNHTLSWWPIHPLGFPLAAVGQVKWSVFSVFVGWLAKFVVVRLGGLRLYHQVRPFFIGMILGYFFGSGISCFVDFLFFPDQGHVLYL